MAGYEPKSFEEKWYERWAESGAFAPRDSAADVPEGERFSIVIPPPNVTGSLHMGHALNNTLQDILVRWHRMQGHPTLWVPGTDHAGIATQNVVERQLLAEKTDRHALGREAFVERTWKWKAESGGTIIGQLRRLGVSCDWSRERFTLDEGCSRAVREVFVRLYEKGRIHRDKYLINWCPRCHTALSDIEVEYEDRAGHMWHLRYPLEDGSGHISVATTRPETMLGDTAVAVHPDDERYKELVGKHLVLPVVGRRIPIIADTYVDSAFGSGAVKITPGHDPNDFEIGLRHELSMISVMNTDGTMSAEAGEYEGTTTAECRKALVERFHSDGTLERIDDHRHSVGTCYRCHQTVEPLLSTQWFVDVKEMADATLAALERGDARFVPAHWEKTYRAWMENIRPWCISRQLWWGHRIPAWYCGPCGTTIVAREDATACPDCGGPVTQDEDVLDTWFSSGLWPFSTLGWPDDTEDLARFYPTSTLVTGFDIIFFWVARMMMMGIEFMGQVPFRDIYIHALVRDEHGQKMSKSKGNVIDPLDVIDEFGADAFRFTLAAFAAMGRDVRLSNDRIAGYRNFVNKLWNAARFAAIQREGRTATCQMPAEPRLLPNRWIRTRLVRAVETASKALGEYRFNDVANTLYQFTWHELCDWYVECVKVLMDGDDADQAETLATLTATLETVLRLLHPVLPFVTEELWQELPAAGRVDAASGAGEGDELIMTAAWPEARPEWTDEAADREMSAVIEVVRAVRNLRAEMRIAPSVPLDLYLGAASGAAGGDDVAANVRDAEALVRRLARVGAVHYGQEAPHGSATAVAMDTELFIPIAEHVDLGAETDRLGREIERIDGELKRLAGKLGNAKFVERAPADVVEKEKAKQAGYEAEKATLMAALERVRAIAGGPGGAS